MPETGDSLILRDVTLREGMDVPGVEFSFEQRLAIAESLSAAGVPEIEIVAPAKVREDSGFARVCLENEDKVSAKTSGLLYAAGPDFKDEISILSDLLDRFDILMPLSPARKPFSEKDKMARMREVLEYALENHTSVGIGFPHALHADPGFLAAACGEAESNGAARIVIFDTDGSTDPFAIYQVMDGLRDTVNCELFFHAHNDLGLAAANSLSAVLAGADGLDVTVNGLGDRAGNASLEQVLLNLIKREIDTGIDPGKLKALSLLVSDLSGVEVHPLAPVLGEFVFTHKSPGHHGITELFEAFNPELLKDGEGD